METLDKIRSELLKTYQSDDQTFSWWQEVWLCFVEQQLSIPKQKPALSLSRYDREQIHLSKGFCH
jgi:hypothetical protein